jgi:hypothetical protein
LEREIHQGFDQVNTKIDQLHSRFDTQTARLDRHAGDWQAGTRWSSRMDVRAEKVDGALEAKGREIVEPRKRLLKLERRLS